MRNTLSNQKYKKYLQIEKILEEYCVKGFKINPYFYKHFKKKKKIKADENGCKYILFRVDVYFSGYNLTVEVDEKGHTDRDLIYEMKIQEALEKKLIVNSLELILVKKIMM